MTGLAADFVLERPDGFRLELDLAVPPGSTAALLGPNGAGKSTAVSALAGLLAVTSGRIALDGAALDDPRQGVFVPPEKRRIGVVFQDHLLFPHLSIVENVAFGLRSGGVPSDMALARSRAWLERLGLAGLEGRRPGDLSGGQAQRVALARALVIEPDLLLLDEPLAALDVGTRVEARHVLREHLSAFGGPRLLITHDPTEAFLLADQIQIIESGRVTQQGTADEIRLGPRTPYAADLAGFNLIQGIADGGMVDTGSLELHISDQASSGPVILTVHPTAIAIHPTQPGGSPRNAWETAIERVEQVGNRVRLRTGPPLPLTVEITVDARRDLGLEPESPVWLAIKATEIRVQQAGASPRGPGHPIDRW